VSTVEGDPRLQQPPATGGDLGGVLAEYGIDPLDPSAIGSSDFDVLLERRRGGEDKKKRASEIIKSFYLKSPEDLRALKRRLHAGGFYSRGTTLAEIDNTDHDDESLAAFENAITRAGAFFDAGVRKTLGQVIDTPSQRVASGVDAPAGTSPIVKQKIVQGVARELLGRELSDVEAAQVASRLPDDQGEAAVLAEQQIESGPFATETEAFDFAQRVQSFYSVLAGPQGPPVTGTTL